MNAFISGVRDAMDKMADALGGYSQCDNRDIARALIVLINAGCTARPMELADAAAQILAAKQNWDATLQAKTAEKITHEILSLKKLHNASQERLNRIKFRMPDGLSHDSPDRHRQICHKIVTTLRLIFGYSMAGYAWKGSVATALARAIKDGDLPNSPEAVAEYASTAAWQSDEQSEHEASRQKLWIEYIARAIHSIITSEENRSHLGEEI
jgi:hypothetical protein